MQPIAHHTSVRAEEVVLFKTVEKAQFPVVLVMGESGTGKTALINKIIARLDISSCFEQTSKHVSSLLVLGSEGALNWLVQDIASKLLPTNLTFGSRELLEQRIIDHVSSTKKCLLIIDNAEALPAKWFLEFTSKWARVAAGSVLLVASTGENISPHDSLEHIHFFPLKGFLEEDHACILSLLGDTLGKRFDEATLMNVAAIVKFKPQNLLYIRWLNPTTTDVLCEIAHKISDEHYLREELWNRLKKDSDKLVHFFSLGLTLKLEVKEHLLRFLWDNLGNGNVEGYNKALVMLVDNNYLSPIVIGENSYALHPALHLILENLLVRAIGSEHVTHVIYYLSLYFRRLALSGKDVDVESLYSYAFYSVWAKNIDSLASVLLSKNVVESAHRQGSTLKFRDTLELLRLCCDEQDPSNKKLLAIKIKIKLEIARCEQALSYYDQCLAFLNEVNKDLDECPDCDPDTKEQSMYLEGIAQGCLGRSAESALAYGKLVKASMDRGFVSARATECIGYLALVESFIDRPKAQALAYHALKFARAHGDQRLLSATLCSVGQVLHYANEDEQATSVFEEAHHLLIKNTEQSNMRESGRLLVAYGAHLLKMNKNLDAGEMLEEAVRINEEVGDLRRFQRAETLFAVFLWKQGQIADASTHLNVLIESKKISNDRFYGPCPALFKAYFDGARLFEDALELVRPLEVDSRDFERSWNMIVLPLMNAQ